MAKGGFPLLTMLSGQMENPVSVFAGISVRSSPVWGFATLNPNRPPFFVNPDRAGMLHVRITWGVGDVARCYCAVLVYHGFSFLVGCLLDCIITANRKKQTPPNLAKAKRHKDVVDALLKAGAVEGKE